MEAIIKDGSNVIAFDAVGFAEMVANKVEHLYRIDPAIASEYLKAMKIEISMENCNAVFDNTSNA